MKKIVILLALFLFVGCAHPIYYNHPLRSYLPSAFWTSRQEAYKLAQPPDGGFYLISFKDAFFWENGVSWKVIIFDDKLYRIYITFAFDADGDGFLEALIPAEYYGMKFLLASHDNVVLLGPSLRLERERNLCLKDFTLEDIITRAPVLGSETGYFISLDSPSRAEVLARWREGLDNNLLCKVLTPSQIRDLNCRAPSSEWWKIVGVIANATGIYGLWDSSVWSLEWFKWVRTAIEGNYLLANILRCPDNSIYGTSLLSRLEGADLMWAFDKYKARQPGYFRNLYLERMRTE